MKQQILDLVNRYWKFDNDQQPVSSWHDKQDLLKELCKILKANQCDHKEDRVYIKNWFDDSQTINEGDILVFEMPPFCSGDYSARIFVDECGEPYINQDHNFYDGCRDFYIDGKH